MLARSLFVHRRLYTTPRTPVFTSTVVHRRLYTSTPAFTSTPSTPPEPRLSLTFTCTVTDCGTRSSHSFTRRSYDKGIVIVQCPGCKNRHLIADHLGWFKESTEHGRLPTIEHILRARGETVTRGSLDADGGVVEYTEPES